MIPHCGVKNLGKEALLHMGGRRINWYTLPGEQFGSTYRIFKWTFLGSSIPFLGIDPMQILAHMSEDVCARSNSDYNR